MTISSDDSSGPRFNWRGHAWTIGPKFREWFAPRPLPSDNPWRRQVDTLGRKRVYATGRYWNAPDAETLVVLLHGLGGCHESDYVERAARAVADAGHSYLRLSLRGADRTGDDIYHGGLTEDLEKALGDPLFDEYRRIWVVGFSLGGHIALRTACTNPSRLDAVAAVCSPLDLSVPQATIDGSRFGVYREYLLRELRTTYREVARRGRAVTPAERIDQVRTLREWDAVTVVPRFGFHDADDYYRRASVYSVLESLETPALLVGARNDPMVPPRAIEPHADAAPEELQVVWSERGGHVYFPRDITLGLGSEPGLLPQIMAWADD